MERETFKRIMTRRGFTVKDVESGISLYDEHGWRAFVSDIVRYGVNTCHLELRRVDFDLLDRYASTPLTER